MQRLQRLPHVTMRWLIIALMLLNGFQLVLLQLAINSSALLDVVVTWLYVVISGAAMLVAPALIAWALARSRRVRPKD